MNRRKTIQAVKHNALPLAGMMLAACLLSACTASKVLKPEDHAHKNTASRYTIDGKTFYNVLPSSQGYLEIGVASWYGKKFHGRLTASGETYDMYQLTAAHKTLPLPTWVRVTNLDNGNKVVLKVNDRGPFHDDRLIDLSWQGAKSLGFATMGTAPVVVEALPGEPVPEEPVPEEPVNSVLSGTFFLQVGAFTQLQSAEQLKEKINLLIGRHDIVDVGVRVLQSEVTQSILHKVWIGPIKDQAKRDQLALWVEQMNLGYPMRVDIP